MTEYDYKNQRWVEGPEAIELRNRQVLDELEILRSPQGLVYLRLVGAQKSVEDRIFECESELAWLRGAKCSGVRPATLYDYLSGKSIRPATAGELAESEKQATHDGGSGVIQVDGRSCYVI